MSAQITVALLVNTCLAVGFQLLQEGAWATGTNAAMKDIQLNKELVESGCLTL